MIIFDEPSHTYTNSETGEIYTSVTTVISQYEPVFDAEFHAKRVANRFGVSMEVVLEDWAKGNKQSTDKGSKIHKMMEEYIRDNKRRDTLAPLYDSYDDAVNAELEDVKHTDAELRMFLHEYALAGTADLVYNHGSEFTIGDFKTNKKFRFHSKYKERFFAPLEHLHVCEFNAYALQLSLYALMHEHNTKMQCRGLIIYYLDGLKWRPIHINYMKAEAQSLLDHWQRHKRSIN